MKRALALIEQQKGPKDFSRQEESNLIGNQGGSYSKQRRNPSAQRSVALDKNTLNQGNSLANDLNGLSSGKSTAISTSTRAGSSKGQHRVVRQNSDIFAKKEKYQVIETSLQHQKKKLPHKLKPLNNKAQEKLHDFLGDYETSAQRMMLKDLENDMKDYLDQDQILNQMKNVFDKDKPKNPLTSISQNSLKSKGKKKGNSNQLEPILEESKVLNQVVPYKANETIAEQRAKKNLALKKKVQQITQGSEGTRSEISELEAETFITGCKAKIDPSQMQIVKPQEDEIPEGEYEGFKPKGYYKYKEDELLDQVDFYEKEMNDMFKYLNEVEDLIKGNDLKVVEGMMDVAKEGMEQHFQAYDKLKDQLLVLDKQADDILSEFEPTLPPSQKGKRKKTLGELEKIEEEKNLRQQADKPSQEAQKKNIVDQLVNMSQNIKEFSTDLEMRLDRAYKTGAANKFGYNSVSKLSSTSEVSDGEKSDREDWKIRKIKNSAQDFLEKSSILGVGESLSNTSKVLGGKKSLPSSIQGGKRRDQ